MFATLITDFVYFSLLSIEYSEKQQITRLMSRLFLSMGTFFSTEIKDETFQDILILQKFISF